GVYLQRLQDQFGQTLRRAHHVRRAYGLVGGDQDEVRHTRLQRRLRRVERAERIVLQPLDHVAFHQADVLVRGRVIDGVDLVARERALQQRRVGDGPQN